MNGWIDVDRVYKPGPAPDGCVPEHLGPRSHVEEVRVHDYIVGRPATREDVPGILELCRARIWLATGRTADLGPYIARIEDRRRILPDDCQKVVDDAITLLRRQSFGETEWCHGDMTLENIINAPSGFRFIDPGNHYGAKCEENDRGKLLQSCMMRWEERRWDDPHERPEWASEEDMAFLVTHWVRLCHHWPNLPVFDGLRSIDRMWK